MKYIIGLIRPGVMLVIAAVALLVVNHSSGTLDELLGGQSRTAYAVMVIVLTACLYEWRRAKAASEKALKELIEACAKAQKEAVEKAESDAFYRGLEQGKKEGKKEGMEIPNGIPVESPPGLDGTYFLATTVPFCGAICLHFRKLGTGEQTIHRFFPRSNRWFGRGVLPVNHTTYAWMQNPSTNPQERVDDPLVLIDIGDKGKIDQYDKKAAGELATVS